MKSTSYITEHLQWLRKDMAELERKSDRIPGSVCCLAVSKGQPLAAIEAAYQAGQRHFAENYIQEAMDKIQVLDRHDICWHFIGPTQKNKTKQVATHFHWLHSLDRCIIAERLNDQRGDDLPPLNTCIQVNVTGESSKSGVTQDELLSLAQVVNSLPHLQLRGLMTVAREQADDKELHDTFKSLRLLKEKLAQQLKMELDTLSMGMSQDYPQAIAEGATMIRIGTAIFGPR